MTPPSPQLRLARPEDIPTIEKLLTAEWLPPMAIREFLETFWVVEHQGEVAGGAGLEVYGEAGVIRSVVVSPALRGSGQGDLLVETALAEARNRGVHRLYLFTKDAAPFFARFGFQPIAMDDFEPAARESWQFRAISERPELAAYVKPMRMELAG